MGRISLYEQSKLPSAVSGYRTSAAPEVAALENVSQSIGQLGQSYIAMKERTKTNVVAMEAQNAFSDFRASYAGTRSEFDQQSKNAPSKAIDTFKEKAYGARNALAQRHGAGLSDEAKKSYDEMVANFNEADGAGLEKWTVDAKYDSVRRESLASLATSADLVGNADNAKTFTEALPQLDEGVTNFQSTFGGDKKKLLESTRKTAITQHVANRMANDPTALVKDLESGAYADVIEIQTKYSSIWKQAAIAAKEQELNSAFVGNLKLTEARDALQKSISDGSFDRSAVLAEYSFAEDGSPEKKMLGDILNRPQVMGGLQKATPEARKLAGTTLMTELSAIGLQKNASKLERVVAYNALSEKAELMLSSGAIDSDTYSSIAKVANSLNAGKRKKYAQNLAKIGQDKTAFKSMHANEDDPLEYVLYRGFDDIGKATKDPSNMGTVREKYMQQVVRAFEAKYGDDDDYASVKQKMKDPAFRDQLYTSIARATVGKDGNAVGFDALRRAYSDATGKAYVNTYVAKDGKQHKIVASLGATTYIEMSKDMLQSLDRKEK